MKTKSRNLIISFLLVIAMLFSVFAITSLTASAVSTTPDPTKLPAETIYVGGVALNAGQYVKNGETTATTGQPAEDTSGFAWHTPGGTLLLVDYTYTGKGYEYSSGNYALIYSTGTLHIALGGENTLKQTQSHNMGIYTVGALQIGNVGSLAIEGDNCSCLYSNNEIIFAGDLGTVNLKTTGNVTAIVSYDNDEDALDEEAIIVNGGDIYVETFYPISNLTINYGALTVSSPQYPLSEVPNISNYDGNYTLTVSENEDGSNPKTYNQDTITTFDINKITDYKYLRLAPPPKTAINSISVSGADLPEVGETKDAMEFTPDSLTYGGEYKMVGRGFKKYTGTEWVEVSDTESLEYGVKYRVNLVLAPNEGYAFANSITSDDVTFNGEAGIFETLISGVGYASIFYEFSYEAPATDYDITIADKDDSGTTVGVLITEENCADVLGDGTVSYDPTTNTLTLNNYVYNGEGILVDHGGYMAIMADIPAEGLTIVLVGTNSITVSGSDSAGMVFFGEDNLTIKGNGSLSINSIMYGITLQSDSGKLTTENAKLNITTTGAMAIGIQATDFVMTSGDLKITASMIGIGTSEEEGIHINGGSAEIGTATGGYAFIYLDFEHLSFNPIKPDLSGYVGAYKMTAGVNADGSDATDFNESYLSSYKYIKITEIESYGIKIADTNDSGETIGVLITEENYTDVLGDGTVSYDPETNTLTLNGYKYEGGGFGDDTRHGILVESIITLNIVLKGENIIDVTNTGILERMRRPSVGIYAWETNVAISGDGSLIISATDGGLYIYGEEGNPSLEIKGGTVTVNAPWGIGTASFKMSGGNLTVNAQGADGDIASAIYSYEFKMTGGNLKITSDGLGVEMWHESDEDAPPMISGGSLDISVAVAGGAFCYYNYADDVCVSMAPDFANYTGAHKLTAGANADGTGATDYSASDIATYKYIKLESLHIHAPGADIKSDASNHWNECTCGEKLNIAPHVDENGDGKCDTCDFTMQSVSTDTNTDTSTDTNTNAGIGTPPSEQNEPKGLGTGAIVGITVGSIAVVGIGGFALIWFVIKKKTLADLIAVFKK